FACLDCYLQFGPGRDEDHIGRTTGGFSKDVSTLRNVLRRGEGVFARDIVTALEHGDVLPGQCDSGWAVTALENRLPGPRHFIRVAGAHDVEPWDRAQGGELLDRLVRRPVFAECDR